MLLNADDLDSTYRRYAAERVAAALKELYRPLVVQDLPAVHHALLQRLASDARIESDR